MHNIDESRAGPAVAVRYDGGGAFQTELRRRVDEYFATSGLPRRGSPWMVLKTVIILAWFTGSYALLVFAAATWWQAIAAAISLGFAAAGVGFSIQHDANHGGYFDGKKKNRAMALTLDLLGGSSYIWSWKHNIFHHTHTNVTGSDPDIYAEPMLRLSPLQKLRWAHRFQHIYSWPLYGLLPVKWNFIDDFENLARGTVGGQKFPRAKGWELLGFFAGKALFFTWSLVLPAFFHPLWQVLVFHLVASMTLGVTLAITFQLAHCVEDAEFPTLLAHGGLAHSREWAVHQVRTTVDFAPRNKLLTWYLGGLNFQVVHHLFPKVCHIHYPALSRLVAQTCEKFGERYFVYPTAAAALGSQYRFMLRLGRPVPEAGLTPTAVV